MWNVETQVQVFVNGNPIPFNMKIGDAGEAFFVFETEDDDVPADLITSPILEATKPGQSNQDVQQGRFGAKEEESPSGAGADESKDALNVRLLLLAMFIPLLTKCNSRNQTHSTLTRQSHLDHPLFR
jgi:phosphatidate phosphatase PAH1